MFTFYWLYQNKNDWLAVFKTDNTYTIANDRESLTPALTSVTNLVSYGNHRGTDKFLAKILTDGKNYPSSELNLINSFRTFSHNTRIALARLPTKFTKLPHDANRHALKRAPPKPGDTTPALNIIS